MALIAAGTAAVVRASACREFGFDQIQLDDPAQCLSRDGRWSRCMQILELAARMRPSRRLLYCVVDVERIKTDIHINLQHAIEVVQVVANECICGGPYRQTRPPPA